MRRTLSAVLLALLAACASGTASPDGAAPAAVASAPGDPNDILLGTWSVTYEAEGSPRQFTLVIGSDGAGGYTNSTSGDTPMGFRIRRISKNGNGMVIDGSTDADLVSMRVSGNVSQMRGTFTVGRRPMGVVMSKIP